MREYKNPITIRKAHLTCPLPLALEAYWACEADCLHCMGRRLNKIWGEEQRAADPDNVTEKLQRALRNKHPRSVIAQALHAKKVLWIGRKSDPYQPIEMALEVTRQLLKSLVDMEWPFIVCSKYVANAKRDEDILLEAGELATFLIEITPGLEADWHLFEHARTTPIHRRLRIARHWQKKGMNIGVRGEPFIAGYHTVRQFRETLRLLKSYGLKSYNTYTLHMNEYTMKRLYAAGLDIERIWEHNQDVLWGPIQKKLCQVADEEDIILGCPDFVNVPTDWKSKTNTCCGVDIPGAFTFNTHHWCGMVQDGIKSCDVIDETWEGIGKDEDKLTAKGILTGSSEYYYTMKDAGHVV